MKIIDFNNINYKQFLKILPKLKISYSFKLDSPELFLLLFPILDDESDVFSEHHIVCGYSVDENVVILFPFGTTDTHPYENSIYYNSECDYYVSHDRCVCIATGRFNGELDFNITTIQGVLSYDESSKYMPCNIQDAGELIFKKYFDNDKFFCTDINNQHIRTVALDKSQDKKIFSSVISG